jgi:hypothetical protein
VGIGALASPSSIAAAVDSHLRPGKAARKSSMKAALVRLARSRFEASRAARPGGELAAPISPSPGAVIGRVLALPVVAAALAAAPGPPSAAVYDLGAGDGRWLTAIAKAFGVRCVGVEIDAGRLRACRERIEREGLGGLCEVREQSVFEEVEGMEDASVVVMYLFRDAMAQMAELMKRRRRSVVVVSVGFKLPGFIWDADVIEGAIRAYVYKIDRTEPMAAGS